MTDKTDLERVADWLNAFKADPFATGADKAERNVEVVLAALQPKSDGGLVERVYQCLVRDCDHDIYGHPVVTLPLLRAAMTTARDQRIAELEAALTPFAEAYYLNDCDDRPNPALEVPVCDLRRAANALKQGE